MVNLHSYVYNWWLCITRYIEKMIHVKGITWTKAKNYSLNRGATVSKSEEPFYEILKIHKVIWASNVDSKLYLIK